MPYPASVGVSFKEPLVGTLELAGGGKARARLEVEVDIPSLSTFLDGDMHVADARARLTLGNDITRLRGSLSMFAPSGPGRRVLFHDLGAGQVRVTATRKLADDRGLDVLVDLGQARVTVSRHGAEHARGTLRLAALESWGSLRVNRAPSPAAEREARRDYFAFLNRELEVVYRDLPPLFADGSRFSPRERRVLVILAHALLPREGTGPRAREVIDEFERFVRGAVESGKWPDDTVRSVSRLLAEAEKLLPAEAPVAEWHEKVHEVLRRRDPEWMAVVLSLLQRVFLLPYYNHPDGHRRVGYRPPTNPFPAAVDDRLSVRSRLPPEPNGGWDVVVVGSGVGGGVLADRLTARGAKVLMLEAGPFVPQGTLRGDEVTAISQLYHSAGMQTATNSSGKGGPLVVLQGHCVGGGAMINNAVCFQLPGAKRDEWRSRGFPPSLIDALPSAYARIAAELGIRAVGDVLDHPGGLNPAWRYLGGLPSPGKPNVGGPPVDGFFEGLVNRGHDEACLGCGLCNNGCPYVRKSSVLQVHLPRACGRGMVIVERARVVRMPLALAGERVSHLEVELGGGERVEVRARTYVLAAGAIGSSRILLGTPRIRDRLRNRDVPLGKHLGANIGGFVHAFYPDRVRLRAHAQITHYLYDATRPYIIESWFNPPAAQAQAIPGGGRLHHDRMLEYANVLSLGVLVASDDSGFVDEHGQAHLGVDQAVFRRLRQGLGHASALLLRGTEAGRPLRVVPATADGLLELVPGQDAQAVYDAELQSPAQLALGTGHPQGGNALSTQDDFAVVDPEFRVRHLANVHVVDASVFPTAAGLNPQWTIMALADLAGAGIG